MASYDETPIGSLRYRVELIGIIQTPDVNSTGVTEVIGSYGIVHASIVPLGMLTFWSSTEPAEMTPTHRIRFRGDLYLNKLQRIIRTRTLPDGSTMVETFSVMRTKMLEGRIRFIEAEVRLVAPVTIIPPVTLDGG